MSQVVGELEVEVTADTSKMQDQIRGDAQKAGKSFSQKFSAGMKGLAVAGATVGVAAAAGLVKVGTAAVAAASDLQETASKVEQLFGAASAAKIQAWGDTAATAMGMSKQAAMDAASDMAIFGKVAGKTGEDLVDFSKANVELASDLGSFFNTDTTSAANAISSALRGESEPMRKYGVIINDVALKQAYMRETGEEVKGTLTGQQKAIAANKLIWEQTADAQGDYTRTSDGLANSQKSLGATLEDVSAKIGTALLPAITQIVNALGPIALSLTGPLTILAETIGTQLAAAFTTLAPLLEPVALALSELGGAVLTGLIAAVGDLIPALTPVVQLLGSLGTTLGPLLAKVLAKVAQILGAVFEALLPVVTALFDLMFEILTPLWPIIELVADVFIMLVNALKPVLGAVIALIKPMGVLIGSILKALMPVIRPLLPVFELLAWILGEVLVRAVGLLQTSLGYLIIGYSKLYDFILNKFIKPVLSKFMNFVGDMLKSSAQLTSWIPGLGDKLQEASDGFADFSQKTQLTFVAAAEDALAAGEEIGGNLVKGGVDMLVQGQQSMYVAAAGVGNAASRGLSAGIEEARASLYSSANAAGTEVEVGITTGLTGAAPGAGGSGSSGGGGGGAAAVEKAYIKVGGSIVTGIEIGLKGMDSLPDKQRAKIERFAQAQEESINKMIDTTKKQLDEAVAAFDRFREEAFGAITGNVSFTGALADTKEQERAVQQAQERLNDIVARNNASTDPLSQADTDAQTTAQMDLDMARAAVQSFDANLNAAIDESMLFGNMMEQASQSLLLTFGADSPIYSQMMSEMMMAGPGVGTEFARAITEGGLEPETARRLTKWNMWAGDVSTKMAKDAKQVGILQAQADYKGLKNEIKELMPEIRGIGRSVGVGMESGFRSELANWRRTVQAYVNATRAELKINSPSKVFAKIGAQSAEGYNLGFEDEISAMPPIPEMTPGQRIFSPNTSTLFEGGDTNVKVFIGEKELTDIVDVQINDNMDYGRDFAVAGRRDF